MPPYTSGSAPQPRRLAEGTPVGTVFFWLIVLLPLLTVIALLFWDVGAYGRSLTGFAPEQYEPFAMLTPAYFVLMGVGWLVQVATIVLAYFDWRTLERRGMDRPFHWAWAFLALVSGGALVYVIGRSVVVRRRSGRGLAPLWVFIGVEVLSIVIAIVKVSALISAVFAGLDLSDLSDVEPLTRSISG